MWGRLMGATIQLMTQKTPRIFKTITAVQPQFLLPFLFLLATACGSSTRSGTTDSRLEGKWKAKELACATGTLTEEGQITRAFLSESALYYSFSGATGSMEGKTNVDVEDPARYCQESTPLALAYPSNSQGQVTLTFKGAEMSRKNIGGKELCDTVPQTNVSSVTRFQYVEDSLILTFERTPNSNALCGEAGQVRLTLKKE